MIWHKSFQVANVILFSDLPSLTRTYKQKRKRNSQTVSSDESDEDEAKIIYAQREARRQARSAAVNLCYPQNTNANLMMIL